jgi:YD repeat-containing protein
VPWAYDSDSRWTWYYHDGVRRVMEVNRDPLPQAGIGGNPEPQGSYVTYADREYVWGPDYVDECLWQVDRPGATAFVLQDANYNVVALVDPSGNVLRQYDYDPYGQPIAADNLGAFGHNRIGHQGLFADRFDADAPAADLAVGAELLYYARNRDYQPRLGRWVQRDPNGTSAAEDMAGLPSYGLGLGTEVLIADIEALYGDGLSLHAPLGSSPLVHTDPTGLSLVGSMGSSVTMLVSNLLARPILGKVAMTGGRVAYSLVDDMLMSYSGYSSISLGGGLIGGATLVGGGLDDLLGSGFRATNWGRAAVAYVLSGLRKGRKGSTRLVNTDTELRTLFSRLSSGGKDVTPSTYRGRMVEHPDGTRVGLREGSKSGGAAIDIRYPDGNRVKVHIE